MRRPIIAIATAVALSVPASVAFAGLAPAGAVTPQVTVTCAKLKGTVSTSVTIKKCTTPGGQITKANKNAYKSAGGTILSLSSPTATIHWLGGATTISAMNPPVTLTGSANKCGTGSEVVATGTVIGGTAVVTKIGDSVSVSVCVSTKQKISAAPGTVVKF